MQKQYKAILLIFTSLIAETVAFTFFFTKTHDLSQLLLFLLLHALFAYLMAEGQRYFIPGLYQKQQHQIKLFLMLFNFMVPVMGTIASWLLLLWGFKKSQHIEINKEIEEVNMEELSEGFPVIERIFGEGSLQALLKNSHAPAQKKIKALTLLTQMKTKASLSLIKKTLSDPDDEVRLVGFSLIDNMEKKINEKIHHLKIMIHTQKDPLKKANYHKELAFTYWELLYQGLVDQQLSIFLIENILHEIDEAEKVITDDSKLYKLEGRVLLGENRYSEAKDAFVKALDLGIPKAEIASFMAEIAFREKNYSRIAYWMQKTPAQSINYQLQTLRAIWVRESR
jgi:tetratricopeptide (TPR) repeat protein